MNVKWNIDQMSHMAEAIGLRFSRETINLRVCRKCLDSLIVCSQIGRLSALTRTAASSSPKTTSPPNHYPHYPTVQTLSASTSSRKAASLTNASTVSLLTQCQTFTLTPDSCSKTITPSTLSKAFATRSKALRALSRHHMLLRSQASYRREKETAYLSGDI